MRPDVVQHERAEGEHLETLASRVGERGGGEPAAESAARDGLVDLGVRERDPVAALPPVIGGLADNPVTEAQLVARLLRDVDDLELLGRRRDLHFVGRPEVLDELSRRIGLARVLVVAEPLPVLGGVRSRLELAQVAVDLARAMEETAVLGLERGDLVGARDRLEPGALFRPRLNLPRDEVDTELGEDLADGGGEGAPLGLVER